MASWLRRLLGGESDSKANRPELPPGEPLMTAEKVRQMIEWSARTNTIGRSTSQSEFNAATGTKGYFGSSIHIYNKEEAYPAQGNGDHYKRGDIIQFPPHISFSSTTTSADVAPIGDQIEVRYAADGVRPYQFMPVTSDPLIIQRIAVIFDYWYRRIGLPEALTAPEPARRQVNRSDKLTLIRGYLDDGGADYFHDVFADNDPVMWVDHREDDAEIVSGIADLLGLEDLSAQWLDGEIISLEISYKGKTTRAPYPTPNADRNTTIITSNELLKPGHELRWCLASDGSDTLAFLVLTSRQWQSLEKSHPEQVAKLFRKIAPGSRMFG